MTTTRKQFLQQSALAIAGVCLPANKILNSRPLKSLRDDYLVNKSE